VDNNKNSYSQTYLPYLSKGGASTINLGGEVKSPYSGKNVRKWMPTMQPPKEGQISANVRGLTLSYLQELNNCNRDYAKWAKAASLDPTIRACIEIKSLRASLVFGEYQHKNPDLEKWVKGNLENIDCSLRKVVSRLAGACSEGFRVAEVVYCNKMPGYIGQWRLKGFNILDSRYVSFEGKDGKIENVIYDNGTGAEVRIPYKKVIHITNGNGLINDDQSNVYGSPESMSAYPYHKAKQAILTEMVVAAKNNSSGLLIGKADSGASIEMVDSSGQPIRDETGNLKTESAVINLMRQMVNAGENGYLCTDKNNEVTQLPLANTSPDFYAGAINLLDRAILRAFSVPALIFDDSSAALTSGTISKQHQTTLDTSIESMVEQMRDQFLEVIKTLIIFNFGTLDGDFGSFDTVHGLDPEKASIKINNIISAVGSGLIPATNLMVKNKVLELLELDSIGPDDQQLDLQQELMKSYLSALAMSGSPIPGLTAPTEEQQQTLEAAQAPSEDTSFDEDA